MIPLLCATCAGLGTFWVYTGSVLGWQGLGFGARLRSRRRERVDLDTWLRQAGLDAVDHREFLAIVAVLFAVGVCAAFVAFGGLLPALALGAFVASFPVTSYRQRRVRRRQRAQEAWPRLIEELRVQTSSLGRSIPHALFEVGARGPDELRPAFAAAHREWMLTTDLARSIHVLKTLLADPTADATCETLLVAHELGGADLNRRLESLAEDRLHEVQDRLDARSRLAGARFARIFVLVVPAGMALAGTSIGNGRSAYQTATGQLVVLIALGLVATCWSWAGRVMRLPSPQRVFAD